MADNTELNAGSGGDIIATDDIGGVKYQRVKLSLGADGSAADALDGAGTVASGVQRVTLASDDPAVVSLALLDNTISGSEMQVDIVGALPAGNNNIGDVDVASVASIVPGTGATNLGKAVDSAVGATDTGVAMLAQRSDTPQTLTPADGDYVVPRADSSGRLWTQAVIAEGSAQIGKLAPNDGVDIGNVDVTSIVPGTAATNIGKAIDSAVGATDTGVGMLVQRVDSPSTHTPASGDWVAPRVNSTGLLWSIIRGLQTPNGDSVINDTSDSLKVTLYDTAGAAITAGSEYTENDQDVSISGVAIMFESNTTTSTLSPVSAATPLPVVVAGASTSTMEIVGDVAHDAAASGNPVRVGVKAESSLSGLTLVADGDATDLYAGLDGVLIVRPHAILEDLIQDRATNTNGTSTAFAGGFAANGSGVRNYMTSISIANSHATDFCTVDIRDGAAGSVLWTFPVPPSSGVTHSWDVPLKFTANTAAAYDVSAAVSTITISVNGFKSKAG